MMPNELDEASDGLRAAIDRAELSLAALALGVASEVPLNEAKPYGAHLGYGKIGGDWCLYIRVVEDRTRLNNASRETRVQAAFRLEALLVELRKTEAQKLKDVRNATTQVEAFSGRVSALVDELGDG